MLSCPNPQLNGGENYFIIFFFDQGVNNSKFPLKIQNFLNSIANPKSFSKKSFQQKIFHKNP
jgi:hypothetical protein